MAEKDVIMKVFRKLLALVVIAAALSHSALAVDLSVSTRLFNAKPGEWIRYATPGRSDIISVVSNEGEGENALITLLIFTEVLRPYSSSSSLLRVGGSFLMERALDAPGENTTFADGEIMYGDKPMKVKIVTYTEPDMTGLWYLSEEIPVSGIVKLERFFNNTPDDKGSLTVDSYGWTPKHKLPDPAGVTDIIDFR